MPVCQYPSGTGDGSMKIHGFHGSLLTFIPAWVQWLVIEISAVIAAAGIGSRFGGLKQFHRFRRRPLIHYCLTVFQRHPRIHRIVLVVPAGSVARARDMVARYGLCKVEAFVPGGKRRQDSVRAGFGRVPPSTSIVVIHDAARPFVTFSLIDRGISVCLAHGAAICGIPVSDTVKRVKGNRILETIDRRGLFYIQTPQLFKRSLLERVYRTVDFKREFTDEAAMVETRGRAVRLFPGDKRNIKVTERSDLERRGSGA